MRDALEFLRLCLSVASLHVLCQEPDIGVGNGQVQRPAGSSEQFDNALVVKGRRRRTDASDEANVHHVFYEGFSGVPMREAVAKETAVAEMEE